MTFIQTIIDYLTTNGTINKKILTEKPFNLIHIKEVFLQNCETFLKPMTGFNWDSFEKEILSVLN